MTAATTIYGVHEHSCFFFHFFFKIPHIKSDGAQIEYIECRVSNTGDLTLQKHCHRRKPDPRVDFEEIFVNVHLFFVEKVKIFCRVPPWCILRALLLFGAVLLGSAWF